MALTMKTRRSLIEEASKRYRTANKTEKARLLDELVAWTGFHRVALARALRKACFLSGWGGSRSGSGRRRVYGVEVFDPLKRIWIILGCPCGKRLVAQMAEMLRVLERWGELRVAVRVRERLVVMSASTADRLLASERKRLELRGRSGTKPGSLLKKRIPVRTFAQWDDVRPGFLEVDLVSHEGGNARGEFCYSLNATDIATGWTECRAVQNRAEVWTLEALKEVKQRLPFPLLGLDSDNGGEFINHHLIRYCEQEKVTFTRSRPSKKNDNCYVEQKNWSVIRQAIGYFRYDTDAELRLLNRLYERLRLLVNYFQSQMKLREKIRDGSRVIKKYDEPQTPYARVLASPTVSDPVKTRLQREYETLNPAQLRREIDALQQELWQLTRKKQALKST